MRKPPNLLPLERSIFLLSSGYNEVIPIDPDTLDAIIKKFWEQEHKDTSYYLGFCSEFAVALDRFLKHKGKIGKDGLFHTIYIYKGWYWDVRGKMNRRLLAILMPVSATSTPRPATPEELKHIYSLLNVEKVNHILKGLRKAERMVKK